MTALIGCVIFTCGYVLSEMRHRAIEKDRFQRSMERFPGLLEQAAGWRHDALAERPEFILDLRDPPEVQS